MHNHEMFNGCINISKIFLKMKRSRGEMHIKEINIFPKLCLKGLNNRNKRMLIKWLHNQIDQTSPQAILVGMSWEVILDEDAISTQHENITLVG